MTRIEHGDTCSDSSTVYVICVNQLVWTQSYAAHHKSVAYQRHFSQFPIHWKYIDCVNELRRTSTLKLKLRFFKGQLTKVRLTREQTENVIKVRFFPSGFIFTNSIELADIISHEPHK